LRVEVLTGYPERLQTHRQFHLAPPNAPEVGRHYAVERLRLRGDVMLLKLGGCDDRNAAEAMRGLLVQVLIDAAVPLEEGEYYHFQLTGLRVETEQGESLGRVVDILETKANDVYVVHGPRGELLLPAVEDVILELDPAAGRMVVHLLPGLLE
jgi:16S rRNA processing protein RimM